MSPPGHSRGGCEYREAQHEDAPVSEIQLCAWGLSRRKLQLARTFLPQCSLRAIRDARSVRADAVLALWGAQPIPAGVPATQPVWRLEDGFLRSVGLGADLVRPLSWVVDRSGIYFDPRQPSDLETLLNEGEIDADLVTRAAGLRAAIVGSGLTKYNLGFAAWQRPSQLGTGRAVVLVAGQVESDASVICGAGAISTNLDLLRAVRADRPGAWVIFKPHPDLLARLRSGQALDADLRACCDEVVTDCAMGPLLEAVDEVHVMTSLAGFEALLRGKAVTTYGMPFYAGWGMTRDLGLSLAVAARRQRRRHLDELVAAALILYPLYIDTKGRPTTPEAVLSELRAMRDRGAAQLPWWRTALRPLLGLAARRRGG